MTCRAKLRAFFKSNFAPAFFLLPAERRKALAAVYAFAREVDDIVDGGSDAARARGALERWRSALGGGSAHGVNPEVWAGLKEALGRYPIPAKHLLGLVDGVARDLTQKRYETQAELERYCYGVASTVGLACLPLFGLDEERHRDFAVNMGYAVQLTNILRDVGEDVARGFVYLPRQDMLRFGYSEEELTARERNERFLDLMRFEAERAMRYFRKSLEALPVESRRAGRPALAMGFLYSRLLDKLVKKGFPVFGERVRLTLWDKLTVMGRLLCAY